MAKGWMRWSPSHIRVVAAMTTRPQESIYAILRVYSHKILWRGVPLRLRLATPYERTALN